jgi:hypothetical protein
VVGVILRVVMGLRAVAIRLRAVVAMADLPAVDLRAAAIRLQAVGMDLQAAAELRSAASFRPLMAGRSSHRADR